MKNQLEMLDEVINNFSDEEKRLMDTNCFPYLFSKAWMYLKIGPEKYRKRDAFQQPPVDYDEEDFQILAEGCKQIINGVGMTEHKPFTNLDVLGFYGLFRLFHFDDVKRKTNHDFVYEGKKGVLDCITLEHVIDGRQVVYYNFCDYSNI